MRKLRIGIIDLVSKGPTRALYARVMNANLASIMPQVTAAWCEEEGHDVTFVCYTGFENLVEELPDNVDLLFISAFTESAQLAYALSNLFRSKGAVTAIGGPHARCYPQDALSYFDYVLGFTDKAVIRDVMHDCTRHRPSGVHISAGQQPTELPGVREIESWYACGNKSGTGRMTGMDKVRQVSEHVNTILSYIPCTQTNFVLGLDEDEEAEPFELTKQFVDLSPGTFPGYSLLSAFGQAAPLNLEYQRANRVLPFPFHLLDNHHAMNIKPKNHSWPEFYKHLIGLAEHTFSWSRIIKRLRTNRTIFLRFLNVVRAVSTEGFGRLKYFTKVHEMLLTDKRFRSYFEQETTELPQFYVDIIRKDLGALWEWLPEGALNHDPNAYLKSHEKTRLTGPTKKNFPL